jgi:hypothetical protein
MAVGIEAKGEGHETSTGYATVGPVLSKEHVSGLLAAE